MYGSVLVALVRFGLVGFDSRYCGSGSLDNACFEGSFIPQTLLAIWGPGGDPIRYP